MLVPFCDRFRSERALTVIYADTLQFRGWTQTVTHSLPARRMTRFLRNSALSRWTKEILAARVGSQEKVVAGCMAAPQGVAGN